MTYTFTELERFVPAIASDSFPARTMIPLPASVRFPQACHIAADIAELEAICRRRFEVWAVYDFTEGCFIQPLHYGAVIADATARDTDGTPAAICISKGRNDRTIITDARH